eukprot:TRINITY_DN7597_c0_g1_i1.p1 TRINITY_DN7597_c0_g1~~TRINITY_DN7597_c0_g1_i1.p1  ORF type:complete len:494 (-),score=181.18 TRINITY_DN7597_c0_g1_i1:7-1488(-)
MKSLTQHRRELEILQKTVEDAYQKAKKVALKSAHVSNMFRDDRRCKEGCLPINIGPLDAILSVEVQVKGQGNEGRIRCEPGVTMEKLVEALLPFQCLPAVVPDLKGITVGGAIAGGAFGSGSFKAGYFHDLCQEYEVIVGDGSLITCSPTENSDLFKVLPNSMGTLGIIVGVTLSVSHATKFVDLRYLKFSSWAQVVPFLQRAKDDPKIHYLDLLQLEPKVFILIVGTQTQTASGKMYSHEKNPSPLYSTHVKEIFLQHNWSARSSDSLFPEESVYLESMAMDDYLFRNDKGCFGMSLVAFDTSFITRNFFGSMFSSSVLMKGMHTFQNYFDRAFVFQNVIFDTFQLENALPLIQDVGVLPPIRLTPVSTSTSTSTSTSFVNVGIYGIPSFKLKPSVIVKRIQEIAEKYSGKKNFAGNSYYPVSEFQAKFQEKDLLAARRKFAGEEIFPELSEKVLSAEPGEKEVWKIPILSWIFYGILIIVGFLTVVILSLE